MIRDAMPADVPVLLELEQQCEAAAHWRRGDYEGLFAHDAPRRVAILAVADGPSGAVLGFVIARVLGPEWEIENLVVAPAARRRGWATEVLQELFRRAASDGAVELILEVRESNLAALRLYEKNGFIVEGLRPKYYQQPVEDALLLRATVSLQLRDRIP